MRCGAPESRRFRLSFAQRPAGLRLCFVFRRQCEIALPLRALAKAKRDQVRRRSRSRRKHYLKEDTNAIREGESTSMCHSGDRRVIYISSFSFSRLVSKESKKRDLESATCVARLPLSRHEKRTSHAGTDITDNNNWRAASGSCLM